MSNGETYGQSRPPARPQIGWPVLFLMLFLAILIWRMTTSPSPLLNPDAPPRAVTPRGELFQDEQATIDLFRNASRSVVHITTLSVKRDMLTTNIHKIPSGTGSGIIWSDEGYIVTNFHVIQSAQGGANVRLSDNSSWPAKLVGVAPDKDLAVLKIDAPKSQLTPIAVGTSADLQVGQTVLAIGNPFGLDQTLTTGVISGLGREIESVTNRPIQDVIQTDAAINPGNSGGALLDSAGRLIGVNTAIYSPSGAYAGIGFAVPVDTVNLIVPSLIRSGEVERPGLGIRIAPDPAVRRLGLEGVLIVEATEDSAATDAGLLGTEFDEETGTIVRMGDLIVSLDGKQVASSKDLFKALDGHAVGDTIPVTVIRDDARIEATVTLKSIQ